MTFIRWVTRNLSSLLLAFILAVVVWISAVTAADPSQEQTYEVPIEILSDTSMVRTNEMPETMSITLYAPNSILEELSQSTTNIRALVDLTNLGEGEHTVAIEYDIPDDLHPVQVLEYTPHTVNVSLEATISRTLPIHVEVRGDPAQGYQLESPIWSHEQVTISGRSSLVQRVETVSVVLDVSGIKETIERTFSLRPIDGDGNVVPNVTLNPEQVSVTQPVSLQGGYRNVVVRVITEGTVPVGYRTTNITPTPATVLVFSDDPSLVESLPGYVETEAVELSGETDDIETIVGLNLPEGVTVIGDPNILVQVGVAALENSITLSKTVEIIGLAPGLTPQVSPSEVEVIIYGPVPVLEELEPLDVRVVVDLSELGVGTHSITPSVEILPDEIEVESIQPETVEVVITISPTPTVTPLTSATPTATISPDEVLTGTLETTPTGD